MSAEEIKNNQMKTIQGASASADIQAPTAPPRVIKNSNSHSRLTVTAVLPNLSRSNQSQKQLPTRTVAAAAVQQQRQQNQQQSSQQDDRESQTSQTARSWISVEAMKRIVGDKQQQQQQQPSISQFDHQAAAQVEEQQEVNRNEESMKEIVSKEAQVQQPLYKEGDNQRQPLTTTQQLLVKKNQLLLKSSNNSDVLGGRGGNLASGRNRFQPTAAPNFFATDNSSSSFDHRQISVGNYSQKTASQQQMSLQVGLQRLMTQQVSDSCRNLDQADRNHMGIGGPAPSTGLLSGIQMMTLEPEILDSSIVAEMHPSDVAGHQIDNNTNLNRKNSTLNTQMLHLSSSKSSQHSGGGICIAKSSGVSSTRELMRMTLEQSQQVLFHGLAFGNTDSIDLENYKSHTSTLQQTQEQPLLQLQKPPSSSKNRGEDQNRSRNSLGKSNSSQQNQRRMIVQQKNMAPRVGISNNNVTAGKIKPQLRIHTQIDDDFQIRSSVDCEELMLQGSESNNTIIEHEDLDTEIKMIKNDVDEDFTCSFDQVLMA